MIKWILPLLIANFFFFSTYSQSENFETFAAKQDALFVKAYETRNLQAWDTLLREFNSRYHRLDPTGKKQFAGYAQNAYYNLACTYALLKLRKPALANLGKAIEVGYSDYEHMKGDRDLAILRGDPGFGKMLADLRPLGDYLYILRKAGAYGKDDAGGLPRFSYQSPENPGLVILRKGFNLDSIAGDGDDVLKVINLMHWVHNLIPHDGNHENPAVRNAMSLIEVCRKEGRGLNCRGLATVLNECYLSMGFKSRFVTCMPKDSLKTDPDCHVINMVFVNSLQKWVWMDPTNDAYVMDENGVLLGIQEVRKRLVERRPLVLNASANWNNKVRKTREDYLFNYMAKNLYKLQCPARSEYNAETFEQGKFYTFISLVPAECLKGQATKADWAGGKSQESQYQFYQISNPDYFWESPQNQ